MATASRDRVSIGRWQSRHLVPFDHPAPERVRDKLDAAVRRALPAALASWRGAAMGIGDDERVFVRRLEIDLSVNTAWDEADIAGACAASFLQMLSRELARGDSHNVVRFKNRAEHVSAYLASRTAGAGATPWFLQSFRGWDLLSASGAIRSALIDDPGSGAAALRLLSIASLTQVTLALEQADAALVLRALGAADDRAPSLAVVRAVLLACADSPPPLHVVHHPAFAVWLTGRSSAIVPPEIATAVASFIAALEEVGEHAHVRDVRECLAHAADDITVLAAISTHPNNSTLREHARLTVAQLAGSPPSKSEWIARSTRFGGLFMLLDDLPPAPTAAIDRAEEDQPTARDLFAFLTLSHCVGAAQPAFLKDALWRELLRIPPEFRAEPSAAERSALTAAAALTFQRFARRLPGFQHSSADYLWRNFLDVAARVDFEPERVVVTLARPPLALVLGLSGVSRGARRWPWLDPRPFVLFSGDE